MIETDEAWSAGWMGKKERREDNLLVRRVTRRKAKVVKNRRRAASLESAYRPVEGKKQKQSFLGTTTRSLEQNSRSENENVKR